MAPAHNVEKVPTVVVCGFLPVWKVRRGQVKLANIQSAIKEIRRSERRRRINQVHRTKTRTYIKRTRELMESGQLDEAEVMARQAMSALDRAAQKGIIHKNNAARSKARLMRHLNQARQQSA